jgi:hypothetical protein
MRTDRRTDMTKVIVACRNFANAPKKCKQYYIAISAYTDDKNVTVYSRSVKLTQINKNVHISRFGICNQNKLQNHQKFSKWAKRTQIIL